MKQIFIKIPWLLIIALVICCATNVANAQKKVAVYVTGDVQNSYKKVIGSKMVAEITKSDNYSAVERTADFLAALTQETDYQASGAVTERQIAKLGEQFGVRYVAVIDVTELFEEFFVAARLIDVQTAKIVMSAEDNKKIENMSSLVQVSEGIASKLIGNLDISDFANTDGNIIQLGPVSTAGQLFKLEIPKGYREISEEELIKIMTVKKLAFPIYVDVHRRGEEKDRKWVETDRKGNGYYDGREISHVEAIMYTSPSEKFKCSRDRTYYYKDYSVRDESIKTGFVYVIKDEK